MNTVVIQDQHLNFKERRLDCSGKGQTKSTIQTNSGTVNEFVCSFLGEFVDTKSPFETDWPLGPSTWH